MNHLACWMRCALCCLLLAALPAAARAQRCAPVDPEALKRLSLEELMNIPITVTSVSKFSEPLSTAAAAVTVITAEDIRRSGATNLPDLLRLATGLQVAQADGRNWAISARGFSQTMSNKLLVLIDGRSIYTPLFSGVFWDVQDTFLADIDRIEVIRGPGATLWGANAVNGVINILTKCAQETQGGLAMAGGGESERAFGGVRYGGRAGGAAYRVYGNYDYRGALEFAKGKSAEDPLRRGQGGFRLDWERSKEDAYTFQGDLYRGLAGEALRADTDLSGGNLLGRFTRQLERGDLKLQLYFDRTHRRTPNFFEEGRDTWDLDFQHHLQATGRQEVVWGVGYRWTADRVENSVGNVFVPNHRTQSLLNVFAQDEITLLPERVRLTLGSKLEHNDYTGFEVQPSVRLAYTPSAKQTVWGAISRAVRTPTRLDTDLHFLSRGFVFFQGNPDFRSESVVAYELGWRGEPRRNLSLDLALFYNDYDHLRTQEFTKGGLPLTFGNKLRAETAGAELSANYQMLPWWLWSAGWSYLHKRLALAADSTDPALGQEEGNDPLRQLWVRTSLDDLPGGTEFDLWLRRVDSLPAPKVPAYTELDLRAGWRATRTIDFSLIGRNLLHAHHPEFGAPSPNREEVQRSIYGRIEWRF
jgi:iron complex outermembrane recepter protein